MAAREPREMAQVAAETGAKKTRRTWDRVLSGKIIAVFFPVMAFVAMGSDHVVANMFFIPAAVFADVPGVGWGDALVNWLLAGAGNLVGAVVFVATSYWYLFLRERPEVATPAAEPAERG